MAFWWVFQNKNYDQEKEGGHLRASDTKHQSHRSMLEVRPNDVIFSYVGKTIKSIGRALSETRITPAKSKQNTSVKQIIEIAMEYNELPIPIEIDPIRLQLSNILTGHRLSPLDKNRNGNRGYLYSLSPKAGEFLISKAPGLSPSFPPAKPDKKNETPKAPQTTSPGADISFTREGHSAHPQHAKIVNSLAKTPEKGGWNLTHRFKCRPDVLATKAREKLLFEVKPDISKASFYMGLERTPINLYQNHMP